ncbi:MAG: hypothetical protein ACK5RO_08785 [Pseudobdellovibrionaceae bacterium]|jgi:hypothetical protein
MAIKKQNKTLLIFITVVLAILGYVLLKEGKIKNPVKNSADLESPAIDISQQDPSQFGEVLNPGQQIDASREDRIAFAQIISDMSECMEVPAAEAQGEDPIVLETLLTKFQSELGSPSVQADRWMNWHLRTPEGKERRLRVEVTESDDGKVGRELHYYAVDRDGNPVPLEIPQDKMNNPTDTVINEMLKEGEVFFKERAAFAQYPNGERIEYIEKDGILSEVEFIKGERFYRCANLKARENCQCIQ